MSTASIWETNLNILSYSFEPGRETFFHAVASLPEWSLLILESGRFRYQIGSGKTALRGECGPGDWVLCPPQQAFHRKMLESCAYHYARFVCSNQGLFPLRGPGTLNNTGRLRFNLAELRSCEGLALANEWRCHLLLDTLRAAYRERQLEVGAVREDLAMLQARDILLEQYGRKIFLESLAQQFRLTPPAFSRRFRLAIGQAPQEFLQERRLDRARQLLLETDLTLDAVARSSGFAGGTYFSRVWKRRYGVAPARYRRQHRV